MAGNIIGEIQQLSTPDKLQALHDALKREKVIADIQRLSNMFDALGQLEPNVHTLGFCGVLAARAERLREAEFEAFFMMTSLFLDNCKGELLIDDSHRELSYAQLGVVCDKYAYVAERLKRPSDAVRSLRNAVLNVQTGDTQLTAAHPALLQVCLTAGLYHAALPFIEFPGMTQVCKSTGCRQRDILVYLYYAGRIYLGTKEFEKACSMFLRALALPCECAHAALWQCRQKAVFASLLAYGCEPEVKMANGSAQALFDKNIDAKFKTLCTAFKEFDVEKFETGLAKMVDDLNKDGHSGLARQCLQKLRHRCLTRLSHTHASASLDQVCKATGLGSVAAAEEMVVDMVAQGKLLAKICQSDGFVTFPARTNEYQDAQAVGMLSASVNKQIHLLRGIKEFADDIENEPMYIWGSANEDDKAGSGGDSALEAALERSKHVK